MENQIVVHRVDELQVMAKAMADTKMFGFKTQQEAFALMLIAQAEGRHPATIAQDYDVIQGRPALKSLAALARFQLAGGKVNWIASTSEVAEAEFYHPMGGTLTIRWDMGRASLAGIAGKDNWKKFPAQMLRARCAAEGVRAVFPACLNGMYVSEEVQDFEPRGQVSRNLDPAMSVDSTPPPSQPQTDSAARLAKIRSRYLQNCDAAVKTMGRSLPAHFECDDSWDEDSFVRANAELLEVLKCENEKEGEE